MMLPDRIDFSAFAFFLDFDGTLVEIAEHPDLVEVPGETRKALRALERQSNHAVAIITGRDIATIDDFLSPLKLPTAGVHGLARRDVNGQYHAPVFDSAPLAALKAELLPFIERENGLLLEEKQGALVLHYRQRPDLEDVCTNIMEQAALKEPSITIRTGKMVIEAVGYPTDKGGAIVSFMKEPPFLGRTPVFAGDDVTDEDGFKAVNRLGGLSIKVGPGETAASYRVENRDALFAWLNLILINAGYMDNAKS